MNTRILVAMFVASLAAAPLAAQEPEVLPPDHPDRPRPPEAYEGVGDPGAIWWPLRTFWQAVEGTLIHFETGQDGGQLAGGLSVAATVTERPERLSFQGGGIGTRSGFLGGGLTYHAFPAVTGPQAGVRLAVTNRAYALAEAFVGLNPRDERPYLELKAFYDNDTMDEFWGIGPDTEEDAESDFGWERWGAQASAGIPPLDALGGIVWGSVHGGWETSFIYDGMDPGSPDAIERFTFIDDVQREFWNVGGSAAIDLRDSPGHPTSGVLIRGDGAWWSAADEFDEEWIQYGGEAQVHLPLGTDWYILSLRAGASKVEPRSGTLAADIPFQYLPALGGSDHMRGFDSWRFRDLAAAFGSVEFRYRIWEEHVPPEDRDRAGLFEASLFFDVGDVADDLDSDITDDLETSYGLMIRMYLLDEHAVGVGVGRSDEKLRVLFTTGDPW